MDYSQALKFLQKVERFGMKLGLENITNLMEKLGNPQKKLRCVHITGTNGKGSVAAMLSSILTLAGYKTGLYTSPNLIDIRERFRINDIDISKEDFSKYFLKVKKLYTHETHFEFLTAMALLYFYEKNVHIAIIEVGLGGRYDATSVVEPLVSVITSISLEHTQHLGNTIEKIAFDKAHIIKKNSFCVTSNTGIALQVIKKFCHTQKSRLFLSDEIDILKNNEMKTNLLGDYQKNNAKNAIKTIEVLNNFYNYKINKKIIKKGLLSVKWPGRIDIRKNIIYDCCHNPAAAEVLVRELKKLRINKVTLLIAILKDKDYKNMIKHLHKIAKTVIITKPDSPRALDPNIIKDEFKKYNKDCVIIPDTKKAVQYVKELRGYVLITGTMYLVGDGLKYS